MALKLLYLVVQHPHLSPLVCNLAPVRLIPLFLPPLFNIVANLVMYHRLVMLLELPAASIPMMTVVLNLLMSIIPAPRPVNLVILIVIASIIVELCADRLQAHVIVNTILVHHRQVMTTDPIILVPPLLPCPWSQAVLLLLHLCSPAGTLSRVPLPPHEVLLPTLLSLSSQELLTFPVPRGN